MNIENYIAAYPVIMRGAFEAYMYGSTYAKAYVEAAIEVHFAIWTDLEFVK